MEDRILPESAPAEFSAIQETIIHELEKVRTSIRRARNPHHRLRLYRRLVDLGHLGEALVKLLVSYSGNSSEQRTLPENAGATEGADQNEKAVTAPFGQHMALPVLPIQSDVPDTQEKQKETRLVRQFRKFLERGREKGLFIWEAKELEARFNRHFRGGLNRALASAGMRSFESLLLRCRQEGWLAIFSAGEKLYTYVRGASRIDNGGGG